MSVLQPFNFFNRNVSNVFVCFKPFQMFPVFKIDLTVNFCVILSSSTVDAHRIAMIGFFSQLVPLRPCGDVSSTIMLHLTAALSDPVASVRAFSIRGLAFVSELNNHDIEKYSELALAALLKGMDDFNSNCFINIPLESLRGLSRVIESIPKEKLDLFEVSLTIRIRPFFDNASVEIRESAIQLFGDLCYQTKLKGQDSEISEALKEQLVTNLFPFLLHMGENESIIVKVRFFGALHYRLP